MHASAAASYHAAAELPDPPDALDDARAYAAARAAHASMAFRPLVHTHTCPGCQERGDQARYDCIALGCEQTPRVRCSSCGPLF